MRRFACRALALLMIFQTPGVAVSQEAAGSAYLLAPDDIVSVTVVNFPNLSTQATVLPDGTISVPILGSVKASGKTTEELAQYLAKEWDRFVVRPSVTVSVPEAEGHRGGQRFRGKAGHAGIPARDAAFRRAGRGGRSVAGGRHHEGPGDAPLRGVADL